MKKKALFFIGFILLFCLTVFIYSFIMSFKLVKKNTDQINTNFKKKFQSIVRVPDIPPSYKSFGKTTYTWDMETREKEVTTVNFSHETGFSRYQNIITATLEMPLGADPSLFNKVLPAVIADEQAIKSAQDLEHPNLGPNESIGYNKIELFNVEHNPNQVAKIVWEFDIGKITKESEDLYRNLFAYPESVIRTLYAIQRTTLLLLSP